MYTFTLVHHTAWFVDYPEDSLVFQKMKLGAPVYSLPGSAKRNERTEPVADSKPQIVAAPFKGDFWAYEIDGAYFLMTRSGQLYSVRFNKESSATSKIWIDEKRPLIGAIQDAGTGKIYAFGTDGKSGDRFAFAMALEPKIVKYKTEAKAGDGFREARDAVRALKLGEKMK